MTGSRCTARDLTFGARCDKPAGHEGAHFHQLLNGDVIGWQS